MKKIKYLLLGIVSILGIGSSFAIDYHYTQIEYFSNYGNINNYMFRLNSNYSLLSYTNSGGELVSYFPYYISDLSDLTNSVFDISNYTLGTMGFKYATNPRIYYNDGLVSLLIGPNFSIFPIVPGTLTVSDFLSENSNTYIRVLSNDISCFSFNSINGNCLNSLRSFVFLPDRTIDSVRGVVYDSSFSGENYNKGVIAGGVGSNYSFTFAMSGYNSTDSSISYNSGLVLFKSVIPTNSGDYYYLNNVFITRLNNFDLLSDSSNYQVLAITFTGISSGISSFDTDFIYTIYDCPSNAFSIFDCTFNNGGYLKPSSLGNSFNSYDGKLYSTSVSNRPTWYEAPYDILKNFFYFLFYPTDSQIVGNSNLLLSPTFYNTYSNNIIQFYRYLKIASGNEFVNYSLSLDSSAGIDILAGTENPLPDSGGGAGEDIFNNIVPFSSLYYQCLGPSYNTPDGYPPAWCLNPDGTLIDINDYSDCYFQLSSDGDIIEQIFCDKGDYTQEMVWVGEGSGGYYTPCLGDDCGVPFVFGPSYLDFDSVFNLSTGTIEDMITNITGRVGKCPFPYTDFQLGKDSGFLKYLKSLGLKYDPFVFVNCVIAGFHEGRNTITDIAGLTFLDQPLIHGDTDQHRYLFVFLDFVVILGFFGLIAFLRRIF